MEVTGREWIDLLSKDYPPAEETLVFAGKLRKHTLRIRKTDWNERFAGFGRMAFKSGREVERVRNSSGGSIADLPRWLVDQLAVDSRDGVCVTKRGDKPYPKRFGLVERAGHVPGWLAIDTFENERVTGVYSSRPDITAINRSHLNELLWRMVRSARAGRILAAEGRCHLHDTQGAETVRVP